MDTCKETSLTTKHGDWIRHANEQLALIVMSHRAASLRHPDCQDEPLHDETVIEAHKLLLHIFHSVPTAPPPVIVADQFDGDLTIVWRDLARRLEVVVHNDGSGIRSFVSESNATHEIPPQEIHTLLLQLAS